MDIGTPLLVLHSNRDGRWHFVISPTSSGWVRDEDIAFGSKSEISEYLKPKNFVVTISAKSSLRVDGTIMTMLEWGVRFPILLKGKW